MSKVKNWGASPGDVCPEAFLLPPLDLPLLLHSNNIIFDELFA